MLLLGGNQQNFLRTPRIQQNEGYTALSYVHTEDCSPMLEDFRAHCTECDVPSPLAYHFHRFIMAIQGYRSCLGLEKESDFRTAFPAARAAEIQERCTVFVMSEQLLKFWNLVVSVA